MSLRQLIPALACSSLIWTAAWAELPALDEPPNYGHAVWIQQLQSLPDLEPGEQVFALLDLAHSGPDDTLQYVVEIIEIPSAHLGIFRFSWKAADRADSERGRPGQTSYYRAGFSDGISFQILR